VAAYEQIEVRWIDELATAQSELLAGTADIIDTVSADAFDLIENSGVARLESTQNMVTADYALDMLARSGPTPFEVKEVRQAVNYAVDWQAIIDAFYGGAGTRQATPVHPAMYGYDETIEPYPYDPDMARELLLQAGYGDGFEIVIRWWGADLSRLISEVIAQYLADVGITATLEVIPDPQIGEVIRGGEAGPMFGVRQATHSGIFDAGYSWAFFTDGAALTYASSPELQNLIDTANAEIQDPARRLELLSELQAYAREEALSLYGFSPDAVRGVSNEVEFQPSPDALDRYATARPAG
jgi:peptide/nickel transport system substrate-binding protein